MGQAFFVAGGCSEKGGLIFTNGNGDTYALRIYDRKLCGSGGKSGGIYADHRKNRGAENLCIIGILSRGVVLAERIAKKIFDLEQVQVDFGALDITPYRDDLTADASHAEQSSIHFPVQDKCVVIVDDVLYTGRSCRAAIDAILALGRPQCMQLAVLVDRGHRELPIRPDYVGKNVPTSQTETVCVSMQEIDGVDCVAIYQDTPDRKKKI
mgnify:CR=1 FL=1